MGFFSSLFVIGICYLALDSSALSHRSYIARDAATRGATSLMGLLDGEQERNALTRESEPEEFFATNTDKMSDEEKLPIALAGLAAISLPFILGMVALYAAQG